MLNSKSPMQRVCAVSVEECVQFIFILFPSVEVPVIYVVRHI